jgi:two-component system response regulator YesN
MYKVLIVDDEYIIRDGLEKGIPWHKHGFIVSGTASNGQEALVSIKKTLPDVIITDVKMPNLDGIQLCKIVKEKYPDIIIIIISGYEEFDFAQKAIKYNVYEYIIKPIDDEYFMELLSDIYDKLEARYDARNSSSEKTAYFEKNKYLIEYIIKKLLDGEYEGEKSYEETLYNAGFEISDKRFCVIAFTCNPSSGNKKKSASINEILLLADAYCKPSRFIVVFLNDVFYVVVFFNNKSAYRFLSDFCSNIKEHIENELNKKYSGNYVLSLGIGNEYNNIKQIKESKNEADITLKYMYYKEEDIVFFKDIIKNQKPKKDTETNIQKNISKLVEIILGSDTFFVLPVLKELFSNMVSLNIMDKKIFCLKFAQIYSLITQKVIEHFDFIKAFNENDFYEKILIYDNYKNVTEMFYEAIIDIKMQIANYININNKYQTVDKIKKHIDNNYGHDLSLDHLSDVFYISPSYISKIFKEETGENLSNYIFNVRIENAKRLLRNTNFKIQRISNDIGYDDYRYFCTVFKRATGLTPLQYRVRSV